jgi:REP-associated tyrosine transposase
MPRERRIEYPGAIYHAMARGNRRGDIVRDDRDRSRFVETLEEAVEASGWVLYGWVLMSNHYHFLFQTPEPNLVQGMSWFQNTWTRRFNTRHRLWGHLFGGRYKAKPVEEGEYLSRLIAYVHLNPVRAGLVKRRDGLESYPWSSLPEFVKPPSRRRSWVAVEKALAQMESSETVAGRRRHLEWLEACVDWKTPEMAGDELPDGQSLQATFRRGWYFGSEAFREKLLKLLGREDEGLSERRRVGYTGAQTRDHGMVEAERIVRLAQRHLGVGEWSEWPKGDWRKGLVAGLIRKRSLVDNGWLAKRLEMGSRTAVSRIMGQARQRMQDDRRARALGRRLERIISAA